MNFASSEIILYSSLIIGALLIVSLFKKEQGEGLKLFLFWGMVIPTVLTTVYLAADTVRENQASATGGPVHWHADFEILACGNPVDLKNPTGISNRIGSPVLHEHGDNRIHVEGVVRELSDVSLSKFFETIGGAMKPAAMIIPTDEGNLVISNGVECSKNKPGKWQVFRYKTDGETVTQEKLADFPNYVPSPHSQIPPGDCIIMEFTNENKTTTENICKFYDIAIKNGDYSYIRND